MCDVIAATLFLGLSNYLNLDKVNLRFGYVFSANKVSEMFIYLTHQRDGM